MRSMFYGAKPGIFEYARHLRNNQTTAELRLGDQLLNNQWGVRFKAQHPIDQYIVDFYCHKAKLVLEIDGKIHQFQTKYDEGRTFEIEQFGIKVIRFTNEEVLTDIDKIISMISDEVATRLMSNTSL